MQLHHLQPRSLGRTQHSWNEPTLGSPVVPFYPFSFWVPLLKPNSRKKGTRIKGLLGNLAQMRKGICKNQPYTLNPES